MRKKPITVKIYDVDEIDGKLLKRVVRVLGDKEELIEVKELSRGVNEK